MGSSRNLFAAGVLFTAALSAHAALIWDESLHGDLHGLGTSVGALGSGTNTFIGTFSLHRVGGGAAWADTDSAMFELLDGYAVTGMRAAITATSGYGVVNFTRIAGLLSPSHEAIFYSDMEGLVFTDFLPTSDVGSYRMFTGGGSASVWDDVDFYWDWQIEIDVAAVPEPVTFALVGAALLGVTATRRRRPTASTA